MHLGARRKQSQEVEGGKDLGIDRGAGREQENMIRYGGFWGDRRKALRARKMHRNGQPLELEGWGL